MREAIVTVASNFSDENYERLREGLLRHLGGDIVFRRVEDESVVGGFILRLDGIVCDMSLASQLKKLGKELADD